jgi:hypothetical protein
MYGFIAFRVSAIWAIRLRLPYRDDDRIEFREVSQSFETDGSISAIFA